MRLIFLAITSGKLPVEVGQSFSIAKPIALEDDEQGNQSSVVGETPITACRLMKVSQSNSIDQLCTVELEPVNPTRFSYLLDHQMARHMEAVNCPVVGISKFMKHPKSSCRGSGTSELKQGLL